VEQRSQRCPHCGLTQWRAPDGICKRCERYLDDEPTPTTSPEDRAATRARHVTLAIVGGVVVAVGVALSVLLPRWLDVRGSPVSTWNDELSLTTITFPDFQKGWRHLRLDRGDLPCLVKPTEAGLQSIRGSFTYGSLAAPELVVCWRMESRGASIGPVRRYSQDEKAAMLHQTNRAHVERAGGAYTPVGAGSNRAARATGDMVPMVEGVYIEGDRFRTYRIDARIDGYTDGFCGFSSTPLHLVQLHFTWSNRAYTVDLLMPQAQYLEGWAVARAVMESVRLRKVTL
jgi:hypothetical protein